MNIVNTNIINVSDIEIQINRKDIKNLHIGVYPPYGRVRVASPLHIDDEAVRLAIISRLSWIKKQKKSFGEQPRQSKREMVSGESHYFLGKRYLLNVIHTNSKYKIIKNYSKLELYVQNNTSVENKQKVLNEWYRQELRKKVEKLISKCENLIGVKLKSYEIRKMKTKWGSCNIEKKKILLNLELSKKSIACIEYVIIHELVHILERHHSDTFKKYMDKFLPHWRERRDELNNGILGY